MPRVDFYVLEDEQLHPRLLTVCRLVEKALEHGHQVHIHTDSAATASMIDDCLWTFRDDAFIPHAVDAPEDESVSVRIGLQSEPVAAADVLINLATQVPDFYKRFERLIEVVNQDPAIRDTGREHFRFFREQGLELHHHPIRA